MRLARSRVFTSLEPRAALGMSNYCAAIAQGKSIAKNAPRSVEL